MAYNLDFVGRTTPAPDLKSALDASTQRMRLLADRVSKATLGQDGGFQLPLPPGQPPGSPEQGGVDLEAEMVSLADEALRQETMVTLLQKSYEGIRSALRNS